MKKGKFLMAIVALMLAFSMALVACDGGKKPPEPTPEPTKYTVTFNLNGATGTAPANQTIEEGKKVNKPTDPTWDETHIFDGWYKEAAATNKWNFDTDTVTKDTTLYAGWKQNTVENPDPTEYTVTFNANGGTFASGETTAVETVNGKVTAPATNPTRTGYTFVAWYVDAAKADAAGEEGKFDFNTELTAATTLYAGWKQDTVETPDPTEPTEYTVTFNANGGAFASGETTDVETVNGKVTAPATNPTRTGYTFVAWYVDAAKADAAGEEGKFDFNTELTAATTLYAGWEQDIVETPDPTKYTVTFDFNGATGTVPVNQTIEEGNKVNKPTDPTRDGYDFDGWYKEETCENVWDFETDTVTNDTMLYAKWQIKKFSVTFDGNGGTFDGEDSIVQNEVLYGAKIEEPSTPTYAGHRFNGWYKDEECNNAWDFEEDSITEATTIYAGWIVVYRVTFNANGGLLEEGSDTYIEVIEGENLEALLYDMGYFPAPTRDGYDFVGWFDSLDGAEELDEDAMFDFDVEVTSDMVLYAGWDIAIYTITYDANGGTFKKDAVLIEDVKYGNLPDAKLSHGVSKFGHTFVGWYTDPDKGKEGAEDGKFDFTQPVTQTLTLYAGWSKKDNTGSEDVKPIVPDPATYGEFIAQTVVDGEEKATIKVDENGISWEGHEVIVIGRVSSDVMKRDLGMIYLAAMAYRVLIDGDEVVLVYNPGTAANWHLIRVTFTLDSNNNVKSVASDGYETVEFHNVNGGGMHI